MIDHYKQFQKDFVNMKVYQGSPFEGLLSASEAAEIWGLDTSTIRKAISSYNLIDGKDCRKFGKQWVISVEAMCRLYGRQHWNHYISVQKAPS